MIQVAAGIDDDGGARPCHRRRMMKRQVVGNHGLHRQRLTGETKPGRHRFYGRGHRAAPVAFIANDRGRNGPPGGKNASLDMRNLWFDDA